MGSILDGALEFSINVILLAALWPWDNSASNRNEYQEYSLGGGVKGRWCVGLITLIPLSIDCLEIRETTSWNPLGL
jgi:hypothetical protein